MQPAIAAGVAGVFVAILFLTVISVVITYFVVETQTKKSLSSAETEIEYSSKL